MENNKKNLIIGSNNSISYLQPSNKYNKLFIFKNRFQSKTIKEQYFEYNVRAFDFKVYFNKRGKIFFKNNKIKYEDAYVFMNLRFLDDQKDCIVKFTLDETKNDINKGNIEYIESRFIEICKIIEICYPNISFIGGTRTIDNKVLYNFSRHQYSNYIEKDLYSNSTPFKKKLRKFCPYLHAKMYNKENLINLIGIKYPTILYMDFVNI